LQQFVSWMMAKDPAQRYPTPDRAVQALQPLLTGASEPALPLEAEPQMKKYLTWLEAGNGEGGPRADPAVAVTAPAASPVARPVAPPSGKDGNAPSARKQHSKKHKRKKSSLHRGPAKAHAARPAQEFDVELVPTPTPRLPAPSPARGGGLSRRDW